MACATCAAPLGPRNRSGYCKRHVSAAMAADPAWRDRQRTGVARSMANPDRLAAMREAARRNGKVPGATEARRRSIMERRMWEQGHAALVGDTEARVRAGRNRTNTVLGAIPPKYRPDYRMLVQTKNVTAAEAQRIILEQAATDLRDLRAGKMMSQDRFMKARTLIAPSISTSSSTGAAGAQ